MSSYLQRLKECTCGAALLEAAIFMPLLFTLTIGIIEFGRALQSYHMADRSLRDAVRYLAQVPVNATCGWGLDNARNLAVFGTISPTDSTPPLVSGWDDLEEPVTLVRTPSCTVADASDEELVILRLNGDIPIQVELLAALNLPSTIHIRVSHEERHIPQ